MTNMFYGHIPSIEQIFETLKKLEVEINDKLKNKLKIYNNKSPFFNF